MTTLLTRWFADVRVAYERRRAVDHLNTLTDAQLLDIGLERGAIESYVVNGIPFAETVTDEGRAFAPSLQGCG